MKSLHASSLLAAVLLGACGSMSADTTKTVDVNKILGGIKDKPTAEAAKGPLESAIASLKGLMGNSAGAADAAGTKKLGADALAKLGINADTMGMITNLLGNPAVSGAIGPLLTQLKGLIGM